VVYTPSKWRRVRITTSLHECSGMARFEAPQRNGPSPSISEPRFILCSLGERRALHFFTCYSSISQLLIIGSSAKEGRFAYT